MRNVSKFAEKVKSGDFIVTAEYLPKLGSEAKITEVLKNCGAHAVNVADNPYGPTMSSLAGAVVLKQADIEPIYQIVTRDRNRIALQSDLMGACSLGITNVLCLSGYHQALTSSPNVKNVYDIDSIQLLQAIGKMNDEATLINGDKINGDLSFFTGAVGNPYMRPIELNIMRLTKKIKAGATFIQTQAIFDVALFREWLELAWKEELPERAAFIATVFPLESAAEAESLALRHTDFHIPEETFKRLQDAGDEAAQKEEGKKICIEIIDALKGIDRLRGIHIMSGGKEEVVAEIISSAGIR